MLPIALVLLYLGCASITPDNYCGPRFPENSNPNSKYVRHLTIISRHGDRSPDARCWPNGPSWDCSGLERRETSFESSRPKSGFLYSHLYSEGKNVNPGNCGKGALTSVGYDQHNLNGVLLQSMYPSLFTNSSRFYVRGTDVPRVYQSAQGLLDSIYRPREEGGCSIVPIYTRDAKTETMTTNADACPILEEIEGAWTSSPQFQQHYKDVTLPLEKEAGEVFGMDDVDLEDLYDCIQATACHNLSFPSGFTQDLYNRIIADVASTVAQGLSFVDTKSGYTGAQIAMAMFLSEVMERISAVVNGHSDERFTFFSGQSSTVLPLLVALGVWKDDGKGATVPYAALLRIEVLQMPSQGEEAKKTLINVLYEDNPISIPGCSTTPCPYKEFVSVTQRIISAGTQCFRQ